MQTQLTERVLQHQQKHLYRKRCRRTAEQWVFCSNDYLGMAQHPDVIAAVKQGVDAYGVSGSSSPLVAGYTEAHQALELAFAKFLKRDAALLFSCGYMANLGLLSVLANQGDTIFADKYIHASLIDAIRLSQAKLRRYPHLDYCQLNALLMQPMGAGRKFIVSDSVFSMQGNQADIAQLVEISQRHQATLVIDDAHGIGILGEHGAGIAGSFAQEEIPILMCPLAKAFGVMGAIVAGSFALIESLVQFARPYIYTHALPPALAVAGLVSLQCVEKESWRRAKLQKLIAYFRQQARYFNLPLMSSLTPIQPIIIGSSQKAQQLSERLLQTGILLNAMRPPTVPEHGACLRVTLTCLHEKPHIDRLLQTIKYHYDDLS
ncbi:MAG: hypothetical protein A3F10_00250 [Coxiella sp. RIFCSPHIGHO2_12_FULL_42_15]|nr:MAG: hypothetical protein A3F10_00250 [Coxiella sp. RIFCSPHIGHO2_12_FULL_42_15]